MSELSFRDWFEDLTHHAPHRWQESLGDDPGCRDRLIRIPTGFGKTAGIVLAWLYHRVVRNDATWPRRLIYCLPMRVLVEQTERAIAGWIDGTGKDVGLHVLMGGVKAERWVLDIDRPSIIVGTQDMLLSRALNRGYAAGRAIWPMECGLLHQDALWTLDEVQLMDVGLATSAQLAAFRDADIRSGRAALRPSHTWWMSATLQPRWLETVDRHASDDPLLAIPAEDRKGGLFEVAKPIVRAPEVDGAEAIAGQARERHAPGSLTLVIVNRVATALEVYDALAEAFSVTEGKKKRRRDDAPDIELAHSRFRGVERAHWAARFLHRDAPLPPAGRIIIATQVVEAGVDISARTLITELAPWSSLVQRFGRAARYEGEVGDVIVVGRVPADDKESAPYGAEALAAADEGITDLMSREADASPRSLEAFEDELSKADPELLERLYPYEPLHVLRRRDFDDLFDTSADLSGADLDVSRFIRSGDDRDVLAFWRQFEKGREIALDDPPRREELCPVPIGDIRAWKGRAYVLDYLDGVWAERNVKGLVPGMTVLLAASDGGYTVERGWAGKAKSVDPVPLARVEDQEPLVRASSVEDADNLSAAPWKTIAAHGRDAATIARSLCDALGIGGSVARVVVLAARWHDAGKAHPVFQGAIRRDVRDAAGLSERRDISKAPAEAWLRPPYPQRPGFRHELASTLALFELLHRVEPFHPALLGPHQALLEATGAVVQVPEPCDASPLTDELASLSAQEFDLLAWLVCSHHGKVRCVWTSTPHDQEHRHGGIHGVCEGDELSAFSLPDTGGQLVDVPSQALSLSAAAMGIGVRYGASWGERVAGLMEHHGPFVLTYLEAVVRVADWRASSLPREEPFA